MIVLTQFIWHQSPLSSDLMHVVANLYHSISSCSKLYSSEPFFEQTLLARSQQEGLLFNHRRSEWSSKSAIGAFCSSSQPHPTPLQVIATRAREGGPKEHIGQAKMAA